MLKVAQPTSNAFHNFKCGEIFCVSPAVYNVTCCLCATKMHLDQFPSHFQMQHLTLAEESINLEELELKRRAKLAKDATLLDNMAIKEEDPEDDPIKQEDVADEQEVDEDDKSLQQLLRETEKARGKQEKVQDEELPEEAKSEEINIGDKLQVEILVRKPNTRNSRKNKKALSKKEDQKTDVESELEEISLEENKANEKEVTTHLITEEEELKEEYDGDDVDMDRDWSLEDKISDTDSDPDDKNSPKDELPFPCLTCKRSYRSKHSLQKHNYSVHNPNKPPKKPKEPKAEHKCDECNEVFRSARDLRGHKWKHTGIFCDICGKPFTQTGNMMRHKIRHTGIKAHKCKECDKEFFTDKELKSHMICHTGLMPVICEICGKRCRDRGVLTAHMRRHTGERPAKCDVCGKSFFSFHDLNVHAVTHSSERPFKCDICGSTFQRKKALRVHKLIHSKDRKHVCKICGKGFAQSGGLNSHMRTHDAALEKTSNEIAQPVIMPVQIEPAESSTSNKTSATNEVSMTPESSSVLGQYMVIYCKMLQVAHPTRNDFHNIKCGEIFCIPPAVYNVTCCMCNINIHLDQFPSHFHMQHLMLAEESINLEELELKRRAKLSKDASLIDNMTTKEEEPQDDPLRQEDLVKREEESFGKHDNKQEALTKVTDASDINISVEKIVERKRNTRNSRKNNKESKSVNIKDKTEVEDLNKLNLNIEKETNNEMTIQVNQAVNEKETKDEMAIQLNQEVNDGDDVNVKLKEQIKAVRKRSTRNARKNNKQTNAVKTDKKQEMNNLSELRSGFEKETNNEETQLKQEQNASNEEYEAVKTDKKQEINNLSEFSNEFEKETNNEEAQEQNDEYDSDDVDMNQDWSLDDKISDIDSNNEDKNNKRHKRIFTCLTCDRTYTSKNGLNKHNYTVHNMPKPPKVEYKCDDCNEVFYSERLLRGHKYKHTGIFCDICGKTFTQSSNMLNHKIRHTGVKAHKCKECDKEFFTSRELKSHMICHTGLPVICEICGKQCRHRSLLKAHMRRHTGERPFKCDVCGKCFFSLHDLNVHAVAHTTDRPFKCDICGSTFQRRKALRIHKLIHSKDRKHVCKICGKGFAQSGGLNSHMRSHDLEKVGSKIAPLDFLPVQMQTMENTQTEGIITSLNVDVSMTAEGIMLGQYMVYK
ncbi:zinc finger protein 107-like [Lucilia cuprina]|uniref:zinc finger protein 107-like n=1 Tax=Lucilia cuprina TaxID=7375 RepID=UPI001F05F22D|nr:zinc finger protein 107-like [Lucilia cuprina]